MIRKKRQLSEVKDIFGAEVTDNSDKVVICYTTIPSTSNTLNNLLVSAFEVEGMVVEHITTLSELSVTSALNLSFISD